MIIIIDRLMEYAGSGETGMKVEILTASVIKLHFSRSTSEQPQDLLHTRHCYPYSASEKRIESPDIALEVGFGTIDSRSYMVTTSHSSPQRHASRIA
jgi:hypothetical protein